VAATSALQSDWLSNFSTCTRSASMCVHPVDDEEITITMPEILTSLAAAS
jgi:hypothetical protein